jgi:hypothetical protein
MRENKILEDILEACLGDEWSFRMILDEPLLQIITYL